MRRNDGSDALEKTNDMIKKNENNKRIQSDKEAATVRDLLGFITDFKRLITEFPYLLISVEGLDTAYQKQYKVTDPYLGSGDDTITINCYETLDMKISSMFNKYLNSVYDRQFRRERVPMNLRRFNCSIYVHDIRNFKDALINWRDTKNQSKLNKFSDKDTSTSMILELALNYISVVEFRFYECEFVPDACGNIFGELNNEDNSTPMKTKFTFKYGNCSVNFLPFADLYPKYESQNVDTTTSEEESLGVDRMNELCGNYNVNYKIENDFTKNFKDDKLKENKDMFIHKKVSDDNYGNVNDNDILEEELFFRNAIIDNDLGNVYYNDLVSSLYDYGKKKLDVDTNDRFEKNFQNYMQGEIITRISASTGLPEEEIVKQMGFGALSMAYAYDEDGRIIDGTYRTLGKLTEENVEGPIIDGKNRTLGNRFKEINQNN